MLEKLTNALGSALAPDNTALKPRQADPSGIYQVRRGDSVEAISRAFGVSVAELKAFNPQIFHEQTRSEHVRPRGEDGRWIFPGDKLRVSAPPAAQDSATISPAAKGAQAPKWVMPAMPDKDCERLTKHGAEPVGNCPLPPKAPPAPPAAPGPIPPAATAPVPPEPTDGDLLNDTPHEVKAVDQPVVAEQTPQQREALMRQGVASYIGKIGATENADLPATITTELKNNPDYLRVASPAQKATLLTMLTSAHLGTTERHGVNEILAMADQRGELAATLDALGKKGTRKLLSGMGDGAEGVALAKRLLESQVLDQNNRFMALDDNFSSAILKATGFSAADSAPSEQLRALSEPMKQQMLKELAGGWMTWGELHELQWLNKHVEVPKVVQTNDGPVS